MQPPLAIRVSVPQFTPPLDLGFAGPDGSPVKLRDGSTGYFMRRPDDCFAAAMATCLQIPLLQVPDWRLDQRLLGGESVEAITQSSWESTIDWLDAMGLRLITHRKVPAARRRWIGVVVPQKAPAFCSHSLVMRRGEILHNPCPDSRPFTAGEVTFGYSFQRKE